ncbi:MAG: abortive infection family protein [Acidobacteriota bacterium]
MLNQTLKVLKLSPEPQSSEDLRKIMSGTISVVTGVGALRTHAGTAHGTGPDRLALTNDQARLAVNAAGAAASYLMETLLHEEERELQ